MKLFLENNYSKSIIIKELTEVVRQKENSEILKNATTIRNNIEKEDFSFPIGEIRNIGFPFSDGNVGNVGAIPLFAIAFKALGKLLPYFQTFDYFVFIEIFSSFFTAYFALKIFTMLGIGNINFRLLGALLLGTSFIMLIRSNTHQPFCVVMFPLFMAWIYSMLVALQKNNITNRETSQATNQATSRATSQATSQATNEINANLMDGTIYI